jgi:hypothetical protein
LAVSAVLSLGFAGGIWFWVDPNEGAPPRSSLEETRGVVTWLDSSRNGLHFALSGSDRRLWYASKFGALGRVGEEISHAGNSPMRVLFERKSYEPLLSRGSHHSVYEIEVGARVIRSWSEVDEAIRSDNAVAPWLAGAFALCGAVLAYQWSRVRVDAT